MWGHSCLFTAYYFDGNVTAAAAQLPEIMRLQGAPEEKIAYVASCAPDAGIHAYFLWTLERMEAQRARGETVPAYAAARIHASLLDRQATLAILRTLVESRSFAARWMAKDVWFSFLRGDREFESLLRQAGLPSASGS